MAAYYNEIDAFAAAWLRELIRRELIAPGDVDERSIAEVQPDDVRGYTQCHFFAGIGVWSYALFNAGWSDSDPVWTGSCPCQPFSAAGKKKGFDDERHLWPHFYRLIRECRPGVVFGEQTSSAAGRKWLDLVCADLEGSGYAVGPAVFPAAGVGAPHQRHRIYWVADTMSAGRPEGRTVAGSGSTTGSGCARALANSPGRNTIDGAVQPSRKHGLRASGRGGSRSAPDEEWTESWLGDTSLSAEERQRQHGRALVSEQEAEGPGLSGDAGRLGNTDDRGREGADVPVRPARQDEAAAVERGAGFWSAADWIPCADGKARPVEPGTFPLAHGAPARVGRLRGYGNALVAPQAQAFIEAYLDVRGAA